MKRTIEDIRRTLLNDEINYTLVMRMTEEELREADSIEDYDDYNHYMNSLCHKYNI